MPFSPTLRIGLNYLALSGLLQRSAVSPANSPFEGITSPLFASLFPPLKGGTGDVPLHSVFCHSERSEESPFCHFWLDPKVTKRSRLRALRTSSRRSQVGKSGNSLRLGQPDFFSPCSLLRRLTARGPWTNAEGVRGEIPHYVRNDKRGYLR